MNPAGRLWRSQGRYFATALIVAGGETPPAFTADTW